VRRACDPRIGHGPFPIEQWRFCSSRLANVRPSSAFTFDVTDAAFDLALVPWQVRLVGKTTVSYAGRTLVTWDSVRRSYQSGC